MAAKSENPFQKSIDEHLRKAVEAKTLEKQESELAQAARLEDYGQVYCDMSTPDTSTDK